jgi:ribose 1,5-bisphosphokinase PhnN
MALDRDALPAEVLLTDRKTLVVALRSLPSVDVRQLDRISALAPQYLSIVMVGGMCAGKSMLAHGAEARPDLSGRCEVTRRYATREPRVGDAADGVTSVRWDEFRARREAGDFALSWVRPLPDGLSIGYGCLRPHTDVTPIFMAGHGVYTNKETVLPQNALENALIVGVYAPISVRSERLRHRSPDVVALGQTTVDKLLAHDDEVMFRHADLVIQNHGDHEKSSLQDFANVLALLLDRP